MVTPEIPCCSNLVLRSNLVTSDEITRQESPSLSHRHSNQYGMTSLQLRIETSP